MIKALKIPIIVSDDSKRFIYENSNYMRHVRNAFVENFQEKSVFDIKFSDIDDFKKKYFFDVEEVNKSYDKYVVGISEQVAKNMKSELKIIRSKYKKTKILGKLRFHKKDYNSCSFKVHTKCGFVDNVFYTRLRITSKRQVAFRVRNNEWIEFSLKEDIYDLKETTSNHKISNFYNKKRQCKFSDRDIKEVAFYHDCGRFYIILFVDVSYDLDDSKKATLCSIDLGIHNPAVIYTNIDCKNSDSDENYIFIGMNNKSRNRIYYLERRAKRLQSIMDKKYHRQKTLNPENPRKSSNYNKICKKFRITWRKIANIKENWRKQNCAWIAKNFKYIVVDDFEQPVSLSKKMSYINRFYAMYLFNMALKNSCDKHNSMYIEAPKFTTRTCSNCGYLNNKLNLSQRTFVCSKCGYTRDRDMNASRNGFNIVSSEMRYL